VTSRVRWLNTGNWQPETGNCLPATGILTSNASLGCQASCIGHDRPGLRAAGDGRCCETAGPALLAPADEAGDAMSSWNVEGAGAVRAIDRNVFPGRRSMLLEPRLLPRDGGTPLGATTIPNLVAAGSAAHRGCAYSSHAVRAIHPRGQRFRPRSSPQLTLRFWTRQAASSHPCTC
jgi:hypothetical protein